MGRALAVGAHVRVWWEDASLHAEGGGEWVVKNPAVRETRGELVAITDKTLCIAHEGCGLEKRDPNDNRQTTRIPRCIVYRVQVATGWSDVPGFDHEFDGVR